MAATENCVKGTKGEVRIQGNDDSAASLAADEPKKLSPAVFVRQQAKIVDSIYDIMMSAPLPITI